MDVRANVSSTVCRFPSTTPMARPVSGTLTTRA
jgi:hypothetical protein